MRVLRGAVIVTLWSVFAPRAFAFTLSNNKTVNLVQRMMSSNIDFHHLSSADSTQDEAKRLIPHLTKNMLAVVTDEQTKGRGTSGRVWMGSDGNLFLTIAFQMERVPVTMTLLPLRIGSMVAERISQLLPSKQVNVKWPNDVLLEDRKVAGVLIESQLVDGKIWLLVGIGVNLVRTPSVPQEGKDRGRLATSVQEHLGTLLLPNNSHVVMARDLANSLEEWLTDPKTTSENTLDDWKKRANWNAHLILRETGEKVMPVGVKDDGQLIVEGEDGKERSLIADYAF
jgi:BirA family transcriptional regulator, biotin operon repressor / biotin---[acetyl-CoA-carboxylase] ligase